MLRFLAIVLCAFSFPVFAGVVSGDANVSVVDNGDGSYDYTFVFDEGSGRTTDTGDGMVFSGLGLDLFVTAMNENIYQCCSISTGQVVQTGDGLGATSAYSTNDGIERSSSTGTAEALFFSLGDSSFAVNESFTLVDISLNGLGRDDAFGGVGINSNINGSRHYAYGVLLAHRTSWVASELDGVGADSSLRGQLNLGANFMVTTSVSMAATNHVCQSDPADERCVHTSDSFIESVTLRTYSAPVQSVPAPGGFALIVLGLLCLRLRPQP